MIKRPSHIETDDQFFAWEREEGKRLNAVRDHLAAQLKEVDGDIVLLRHWGNNRYCSGWGT